MAKKGRHVPLVSARHVLDYYMDGHQPTPFCKVCSAEGLQLLDDCKGPYVSGVLFFKHMTREEFEKEFGPVDEKCIDAMKPKG